MTAGQWEARVKWAIVAIALAAAPLFADDVHLRGGGQITGEIVEQTADSVTVNIGGGTMSVRMSSVVRIERSTSPIQEYRARAGSIRAGDAEAWRELARWAESQALATAAGEAWSKVVAIVPDDPEANRALGRVELDGRWITEEESYRARGYVEFEREWMTPGERQAILEDRRASEQADRQAEAARLQAEQQAEREREAQEAAEQDGWNDWATVGYPGYWGWGPGPAYWPSRPGQGPRPGGPATLPAGGRR
jgi:hypothetical protein